MSKLISDEILHLSKGQPRVCLPYGLELLDLARWFIITNGASQQFQIAYSGDKYIWSGSDVINLFNAIQSRCTRYILPNTFVISKPGEAMYFFDEHERFSFFSAPSSLLRQLFPFTQEVMWENFALVQEEDDDWGLREIFESVHSA